jgi:hypothetical protein
MDIGDYIKEGSELVDGSLGDSLASGLSCIKIDRQYYTTVSTDRELNLALDKRFKGKTTLYVNPSYATLVWLCLATEGYKVSSSNLNNVSDDDVSQAWEFVDTVSVSSTKRCREMISLGKNNRNSAGFLRSRTTAVRLKAKARVNRVSESLRGPPVVLQAGSEYDTEHDTIEDAMLEDCMKWVSGSDDPVRSTVLLRTNILSGTKSIEYPRVHR